MLLKFAWEDLWAICLSIDVINVGRMPRRKLPQTVPRLAHHQTTTNCEFSRMFSCWLLMYKRDWHKSSYQRESQPPANPIILLKGHHQLNVKFIHHFPFNFSSRQHHRPRCFLLVECEKWICWTFFLCLKIIVVIVVFIFHVYLRQHRALKLYEALGCRSSGIFRGSFLKRSIKISIPKLNSWGIITIINTTHNKLKLLRSTTTRWTGSFHWLLLPMFSVCAMKSVKNVDPALINLFNLEKIFERLETISFRSLIFLCLLSPHRLPPLLSFHFLLFRLPLGMSGSSKGKLSRTKTNKIQSGRRQRHSMNCEKSKRIQRNFFFLMLVHRKIILYEDCQFHIEKSSCWPDYESCIEECSRPFLLFFYSRHSIFIKRG